MSARRWTGKGARAAGEVHADMLQMLVDADADLLSDTLRETLIRWLVGYNFPGACLPTIWRVRPANEQAEAETEEKKAAAAIQRDKAIRQVAATAAQFENDDDAREYIREVAPGDLDADMLDRLVEARFAFAARAKAEGQADKKKT